MKTPQEINWYPLDVKKDGKGGLWFYVPRWIVRAFKLKSYGSNMGKVKFIIKRDIRAIIEYHGEQRGASEYFKRNWCTKLRRENKRKRNSEK